MAKKQIDFSKLTLRQILLFFGGLAIAVSGMVMSIILLASTIYEDGASFPVTMKNSEPQVICEGCMLEEGDSIWLVTENRKIEYTDINIAVSVAPEDGSQAFANNTSFVVVSLRNQTGGTLYYRLATPEAQIGKKVDITIQKSGADVLDQSFSIMFRKYGGVSINPLYIIFMIVGLGLIFMSTRKK